MTLRSFLVTGLSVALGALCASACGDTNNVALNSLNLNRPIDIAFACHGGVRPTGETGAITAPQPTTSCDFRSQERTNPTDAAGEPRPPGQENVGDVVLSPVFWYGFILQSSSGTVAIAQWGTQPASTFGTTSVAVLDADPLTPGKNAISVGENPVGIETDKTGCFEVTANAGSCDLSVLDVDTAVLAATTGVGGQVKILRLPVKTGSGKQVLARPAAIVGEPSLALSHVGDACPTTPAPDGKILPSPRGLAFVAYPGCHMVAGLDLSDGTQGKVTSVIKLDGAGVATVVTDAAGIDAAVDACAIDCADTGLALKPPVAGTRPVALAYNFDAVAGTRKLAIGADNSKQVSIVSLENDADDTKQMQPLSVVQVPLATNATDGTFGVTQIALSPQLSMGGTVNDPYPVPDSVKPGGVGQYVYAVATDATVRVIDVLGSNNVPANTPTECDTQIDPRAIAASPLINTTPLLQCYPVGLTLTGFPTPPQRKDARGPGIELPRRQVPLSVAFIRAPAYYTLDPNDDTNTNYILAHPTPAPTNLYGTFAVVSSTAGATYVVNVDDDNNKGSDQFDANQPQLTAPVEIMAHQLRDNVSNRDTNAQVSTTTTDANGQTTTTIKPSCTDLGTNLQGGPRASAPPAIDASLGGTVTSKVGELPFFPQERCVADDAANGVAVAELMLAAKPATRARVFPDLKSIPLDESWVATWEGRLSNDGTVLDNLALDGPPVRQGNWLTKTTTEASILDPSNPFCGMGVEPYDIVQMRGCNPNNGDFDCPTNYKCYVHADTVVQVEGVAQGSCMLANEADRLATACRDYLISQRRYTVRKAATGELVLMPRKHELDATPLDGCTDDAQCQAYANAAAQTRVDVFDPAATLDTRHWSCVLDDQRAPLGGDPSKKRCVQTCTVHEGGDRDDDCDVGSLCIGPAVGGPGTCMEGVIPPQSCMNAPQRFEVRGHEAFVLIGDETGYAHPIIAKDGQCVTDPNADPFAHGRIPLTAPACTGDPITGETAPGKIEASPCSTTVTTTSTELSYPTGNCAAPTSTLTDRTNVPAIRVHKHGMTITIADPTYPGDAKCPLDRGGAPGLPAGSKIPLTFPNLALKFHVTAGYSPLSLSTNAGAFNPVFPVKVVAGPGGSIWVVDAGDFLTQTFDQASTLGSVFRVESIGLGTVNLLQ